MCGQFLIIQCLKYLFSELQTAEPVVFSFITKGDVSKLEKFRSLEVQKFSQMHKYLIIRYHYSNDRTSGLLNSLTSPILIHPLISCRGPRRYPDDAHVSI